MPYVRQLHVKAKCPGKDQCDGCGKWAATVRVRPGSSERITVTHRLQSAVEKWAREYEADSGRGIALDPRPAAKTTVGEWWERTHRSRHLEMASRKRDESHWRVHVKPRWEHVVLGDILKSDVSAWVVDMQESHADTCRNPSKCPGCRVGAATVEGAVGVLRTLLDLAVEEKYLTDNPARRVNMRPRDAHVDRILDVEEQDQLVARAGEVLGDRVDGQLMVELMLDTGMRWEEVAALPPEMIDTKRQIISIAWVMERNGTARPYAKSDAGNRDVPYGNHLAGRLAKAKLAAPVVPGVFPVRRRGPAPTRLVFWSPGGGGRTRKKRGEPGPVRYDNWRRQVWVPSLRTAATRAPKADPTKPGPGRLVAGVHYLNDPQPTPHDLRHTAITELANGGMQLHDLMKLSGHSDVRAIQRYLHSTDARFEAARRAKLIARGIDPDAQPDAAESGS